MTLDDDVTKMITVVIPPKECNECSGVGRRWDPVAGRYTAETCGHCKGTGDEPGCKAATVRMRRPAWHVAREREAERDLERRLTARMCEVMGVLLRYRGSPMAPNQIGRFLGFHHGGSARSAHANHAGRIMGLAQHVIGALTALRKLGMVEMRSRPDGMTGTAYELTTHGVDVARKVKVSRAR